MPRQQQGSQRDFSFGEIDPDLKRADEHPARRGGLRQMKNVRIHNSGALQNRSGRRALYVANGGRNERFTISAGQVFDIEFSAGGGLQIFQTDGTLVAHFTLQGNGAPLPWDTGSFNLVVYAIFNQSIYITFPGMRPQVVGLDQNNITGWSIADYNEAITTGGRKQTPFYRLSPQGITLQPSGISGQIPVTFSAPIVQSAMTGTRIRWAGRQILLGPAINAFTMNATAIEPLPPAQILTLSTSVGNFTIGDEVIGSLSGAIGIVAATPTTQQLQVSTFAGGPAIGDFVTGGTSGASGNYLGTNGADAMVVSLNGVTVFVAGETISGIWGSKPIIAVSAGALTVQLLQNTPNSAASFAAVEDISGPSGSGKTSAVTTTIPQAIAVWDDELINGFRGYPASCFTDQFRLGFCNFPALPGAIAWSAINAPYDLNVGPNPDDAMLEIAPAKVQVYYVVPGPESSEFVFCDRRIYYIPISPTNPLKPGSVQFQLLSGDGAALVQPRNAQEAILYINAGQNSVMAVIATGAYFRPFNTKNLSDFHAHLFNTIQCIAAPSADGTFNERYAYILNYDGSIVVGKYSPESLPGNQPVIGWGPWFGNGVVSWISAFAADVVFTSGYFGAPIVEILDDNQYLDCSVKVNALPVGFTPPVGKGPLWFIPGRTVTLIDQGTRMMGTYQIDANGFIIPQGHGGEDLASASLVAGQPWTMFAEPFCPAASPGSDVGQRMDLRYVARFVVHVANSTGFVMAKLFSSRQTATSPALGTVMNQRRVPAWNVDDDPTAPPKLRETAESWRPSGGSYDPRVAIYKDTPGPLTIEEIGLEITL